MTENPTIKAGEHAIELEGELGAFRASLTSTELAENRHVVTLAVDASAPAQPPELALVFSQPVIDIQARWVPKTRAMPGLQPEWDCNTGSQMTREAPVAAFFNLAGANRLTFACSDAERPVALRAGVHEESASLRCSIRFFKQDQAPIDHYEVSILIDTRDIPYYRALRDVAQWWADDVGYSPFPVPDRARVPVYSTWYSFHQTLVQDEVIRQCRMAKELGCEVIIIDDGWQTTDAGRGYPYTGDWEPVRIGDAKAFVDAVHATGLKCLFWYALPFAGKNSEAIKRFDGKTITFIDGAHTSVLDPRYAEVRAYLSDKITAAMRDWGLDGFKLDFVDWFDPGKAGPPADGMDCADVNEGTHLLLTNLTTRLREMDPDVILEFRQPYIGPAMRRYANMFRSVDCPNDSHTNRINTLDLRLLCDTTAIHSDMFMWNLDEPADAAALQLLNVLFSVPQVSVLIDKLPRDHHAMLQFWLAFWREHRNVLIDGQLQPLHPENWYPIVIATNDSKRVVAVYGDVVVNPGKDVPRELFIINATRGDRIVLELDEDAGEREIIIKDCRGQVVAEAPRPLSAGLHRLDVPASGLITLR